VNWQTLDGHFGDEWRFASRSTQSGDTNFQHPAFTLIKRNAIATHKANA